MSRRRLGKERTELNRLDATAPNTARKSGSGISRLVETLNNDAWLQRQHMNNVYGMKKQNDNTEIVMSSEPLHHTTLSLSSWK